MKKNLRRVISLLFIIIFIGTCCLYVYNNKQNDYIANKFKEIHVVLDDNYPPYVVRDDQGNLSGILVDEWNLWSIKTGIKVKLFATSWDNALKSMNEEKFDVIDTIFKNEERKQIYDFSEAYTDIDVSIFFNNKLSAITDIASLKGFKIAVKKGDNCINLLKEKNITNYMEFYSYEDIVRAAKDGTVDVFIMDKPPALYFIYKYGIQDKFKFSEPQYTGQFHRAVKKGNKQLLKVVEQGFSKISKSEHTKIYNKWFGFKYISENNSRYLILGFFIIFTFCGIMIFLNIILKKRVKQKTRQLTEVIEKLTASENRISAIFEANPDMFFILNDKYEFTDYKVNSEGELIFEPNFFIGKKISEVFNEEISNNVIAAIKRNLETDKMQIVEYSYKVDDETKYYEARIVRYLHNQVLSVIRDITEKKQTELKMYEMSIKDSMTGLYNRDYFESFMESLEVGSLDSLIIVMCDLDGLKFINDTLGHVSGDNYLKKAANLINKVFNIEDSLIARIGGDEFGIILKNRNEETVIKMKEKLMQLLEEENINNSDDIPLSISVGYSVALGDRVNIKRMIKEADDYMYRQKLQNKQSTKNDLVKIITKMLETRDFITEGHCDRLQYLGVYLAKKIGLEDKYIQDISLFCKFHDIGKIGISDNILFKPGKLTTEEFEEMKKHTEIGYRIAKASPDIAHLGEYILKHHEWWNGMGYPLGLKGEDIPIQCRILSIVDAYDAMISDRPYRKALSKKEALDEIIRFSGKQFDPKLVDKFCEIINELDMNSIDRLEVE